MQFRLLLNNVEWQVRYNQSGAVNGWSEWESLDRTYALSYIERGFSFDTIY